MVLGIDGLAVIAEVSIGLAGFSGVMIALTRASGGFNPPERFRLVVLVYSSMGPLFFAMAPFAVLDGVSANEAEWRVLGSLVSVYAFVGLLLFPRTSFRLRRSYPEIFPLGLIATQTVLHGVILVLALSVAFNLTDRPSRIYTAALIVLLLHGAIAFVRLLFYRRHEPVD